MKTHQFTATRFNNHGAAVHWTLGSISAFFVLLTTLFFLLFVGSAWFNANHEIVFERDNAVLDKNRAVQETTDRLSKAAAEDKARDLQIELSVERARAARAESQPRAIYIQGQPGPTINYAPSSSVTLPPPAPPAPAPAPAPRPTTASVGPEAGYGALVEQIAHLRAYGQPLDIELANALQALVDGTPYASLTPRQQDIVGVFFNKCVANRATRPINELNNLGVPLPAGVHVGVYGPAQPAPSAPIAYRGSQRPAQQRQDEWVEVR